MEQSHLAARPVATAFGDADACRVNVCFEPDESVEQHFKALEKELGPSSWPNPVGIPKVFGRGLLFVDVEARLQSCLKTSSGHPPSCRPSSTPASSGARNDTRCRSRAISQCVSSCARSVMNFQRVCHWRSPTSSTGQGRVPLWLTRCCGGQAWVSGSKRWPRSCSTYSHLKTGVPSGWRRRVSRGGAPAPPPASGRSGPRPAASTKVWRHWQP